MAVMEPTRTTRSTRWALTGPLTAGAAALAATAFVAVVDPNEPGSYPLCPWLAITHTWCPGCGGLRAVHALTRGDIATAAQMNALAVALLPVVLFLWGRWLVKSWRGERPAFYLARPGMIAGLALIPATLLFWVVRNLPIGAFLAP